MSVTKQHGADRRNHQIGKDQQDSRYPDRAGDHQTKRRIKDEVPEPDFPTVLPGLLEICRDRKKTVSAEEMDDGDAQINPEGLPYLRPIGKQYIAQKHGFDLFRAMGRLVEDEDRRRRRHCIGDADDGFLGNPLIPEARNSEDRRTQKGKTEGKDITSRAMKIITDEHANGSAQGGYLGEGEVDENDTTGDDMQSQVAVDACQDEADYERGGKQMQEISHKRLPT